MTEIEYLIDKYERERANLMGDICTGVFQSFDLYREATGRMKGLDWCIHAVKTLKEHIDKKEDGQQEGMTPVRIGSPGG